MIRRANITHGSEGHTLVEVVVALAVLLTVLVPVAMTAVHAMESRSSRDVTEALIVAQSAMEEAMILGIPDSLSRHVERWVVHATSMVDDDMIWYEVNVVQARSGRVVVSLRTARFLSAHRRHETELP